MKPKTGLLLFILLSYGTANNCPAQTNSKPGLTIGKIMQGPGFVGHLPENIQWGDDNKTIFFSWNPDNTSFDELYKTTTSGNTPLKVSIEEKKSLPPSSRNYNKTYSKMVYSKNGDLFMTEIGTLKTTQITNTVEVESNPQFSGDELYIVFKKSNNLFSWNIESGVLAQVTNFKSGAKPDTDKKLKEPEEWLETDQLGYFQILSKRKDKKDKSKDRSEGLKPNRPREIYIGAKSISNIEISPNRKFVTYRFTEGAKGIKSTDVMDYVTSSGFSENLKGRPKVAFEEVNYEMGLYDIESDTSFVIMTDGIVGIKDKPEFLKEYHEGVEPFNNQYENPRKVIVHSPIYSEHGRAVVVIRSQDNKDRWIMELLLPSGELKLLDRQRDEAWIGGPGISSWNMSMGNVGWLDDTTIWFQSEETGYSHLYTLDVNSKKKKSLTKGKFEVLNAKLSRDKKNFYLTTNEIGPDQQHFYKLSAKGGKPERITSLPGAHKVTISPDEKNLAILYSYSNKPWELYLMPNKPGSEAKQVTFSTTKEFMEYPWREPGIIKFTAGDGAKVSARLYKPKNAVANGPAIIFVHGAGYLQNVHKWWSSYYREYMFHNFLTDNGYTVLDIDYRGSAGYGRDWRTGIYRHMGGKDLSDQLDGVKYLVVEHNIDPKRIGIYGGSYGGFITIMALFTSPGTFQSGAALRSVTDWAHYNHGYTSNILNTPVEDSLAYYKSSPIYHAGNLKDKLLMLHGMVDTNVQFQDVVRLSQRLIELGKDNWELAVFPMEGHGFVEPSSWTDEYKRIYKLFEGTLK